MEGEEGGCFCCYIYVILSTTIAADHIAGEVEGEEERVFSVVVGSSSCGRSVGNV